MPFPPPEQLSDEEFAKIPPTLAFWVSSLPPELPSKKEDSIFSDFLARPFDKSPAYKEWVDKADCKIGALNRMLKKIFGWDARSIGDGRVDITERGPGITAMSEVLMSFYEKHPQDNIVRKLFVEIANDVEHFFEKSGAQVSRILYEKSQLRCVIHLDSIILGIKRVSAFQETPLECHRVR